MKGGETEPKKRNGALILVIDNSAESQAVVKSLQEKKLPVTWLRASEGEFRELPSLIAEEGWFRGRKKIEDYIQALVEGSKQD